jgi:hypothetical protein
MNCNFKIRIILIDLFQFFVLFSYIITPTETTKLIPCGALYVLNVKLFETQNDIDF